MTVEAEMGYRALLKKCEPVATIATATGRVRHFIRSPPETHSDSTSNQCHLPERLVILLREGLEVILVLAAIFALLIKGQRRDACPMHAGWIAALALGGITWLVASSVVAISGPTREMIEGVGPGGGGNSAQRRFPDAREGVCRSLARLSPRSTAGGLIGTHDVGIGTGIVSAVYREAFETVLFYQALWVQVAPAYVPVLGGLISGWGPRHPWMADFSRQYPPALGLLFGATSLLLALLAVVFVGKGIAALQEAGTLPVNPVNIPNLPALGLYPSLQGLVLQTLVVLVIASAFAYARHRAQDSR